MVIYGIKNVICGIKVVIMWQYVAIKNTLITTHKRLITK